MPKRSLLLSLAVLGMAAHLPLPPPDGVKTAGPKTRSGNDLIAFGGAVKTSKTAEGKTKAEGYLVRFTSAKDPDLAEDFFTAKSYFGEATTFPVYFHHGFQLLVTDPDTKSVKAVGPGKTKIGVGEIKADDTGLFISAIIDEAGDYQAEVDSLLEAGVLGWSSGAVSHLVDREEVTEEGKSAHWVKSWPLGEASLTHTPCEPRNVAGAVKSVPVKIESLTGKIIPISAIAPEGSPEAKSGALEQYGVYSWRYKDPYYQTPDYTDWDPGKEMVRSCYDLVRYRLDNAVYNIAGDESMTPDEQGTAIEACFTEASTLTVGLLKALATVLPIQDGDGDEAKALLAKAKKSFSKYVGEGVVPPTTSAKGSPGVPLAKQGEQVLDDLKAYTRRLSAVASLRATKSGSTLSAAARATLEKSLKLIQEALGENTGDPASDPVDPPAPEPTGEGITLSADDLARLESLGI